CAWSCILSRTSRLSFSGLPLHAAVGAWGGPRAAADAWPLAGLGIEEPRMVTNPFGHLGGLNRLLGDTARRRSAALVVSTLVGLLYFAGCSNWTTASSGAASAKDAKVADAPGRFVFLQARLTGSAGDERSVVDRL